MLQLESEDEDSRENATRTGAFQRNWLGLLYDLYTSDSLQKAVTALYAKILVIMGEYLTKLFLLRKMKSAT